MGEAPRRMEYNNSVSIFNWFVDHNFVDSSRIAEIIYKDIWLKPLPYYLGTQVSEDGMEKGDEQPVTLGKSLCVGTWSLISQTVYLRLSGDKRDSQNSGQPWYQSEADLGRSMMQNCS
ncbi:testis-specific Y-encoded protein 2-like [Ochotona princeps]|nr:testis-specific Y-encoded protein 2-like [Ochotona princeps]